MGSVKVFVSHSGADDDFSLQLVEDLRQRLGETDTVWYDNSDGLHGGDEWWNEVVKQITERDVFLVILSPDAMTSKWVNAEIGIAWHQRVTSGKRIIPLLYRPTTVRADLNTLDIISFERAAIRSAYNKSLDELVSVIQTEGQSRPSQRHVSHYDTSGEIKLLVVGDDIQAIASTQTSSEEKHESAANSFLGLEGILVRYTDGDRFNELRYLVREAEFDVMQFISFDSAAADTNSSHARTRTENLTRVLRYGLLPDSVHLLVLCGNLSEIPVEDLLAYVPYTLTVSVNERDEAEAAITFLREFYTSYALYRDATRAFDDASFLLRVMHLSPLLGVTLRSRARHGAAGNTELEIRVKHFPDPLVVDLGPVESKLDTLGIPRDDLLKWIARKIEVHAWIFSSPRDNATLPVGPTVLGVFSWGTTDNRIRCDTLIRIKESVNPEHWQSWSRILIIYNDLCSEEYRGMRDPAAPTSRTILHKALIRSKLAYDGMQPSITSLSAHGHPEAALSYSLALSFLERADAKFIEEDLRLTVSFLESALTSIHDILTACMPEAVVVES